MNEVVKEATTPVEIWKAIGNQTLVSIEGNFKTPVLHLHFINGVTLSLEDGKILLKSKEEL